MSDNNWLANIEDITDNPGTEKTWARPVMTVQISNDIVKLKSALRKYPDFPVPDILPIFRNPELFEILVSLLTNYINDSIKRPTKIVALDARGFLFAPTVALRLKIPFVPVRKVGKLPGETIKAVYQKEYGQDAFEIQADAITSEDKVIVIDDILATGGSAAAAGELVKKAGAQVLEYIFLLELEFLKGREKLDAPVMTLLKNEIR